MKNVVNFTVCFVLSMLIAASTQALVRIDNLLMDSPQADSTKDGVVNIDDFAALADQWLTGNRIWTEDFETGDFSRHNWQCDGWAIVPISVSGGTWSTMTNKHPSAGDDAYCTIEVTLDTANTVISFYLQTENILGCSYMTFYINGIAVQRLTDSLNWTQLMYSITPGRNTFKWEFYKLGGFSDPDYACIDNIRLLTPASVNVPDFTYLSPLAAGAAANNAGLFTGATHYTYSSIIETGLVMSQTPAAGQTVPSGTAVNLVVSMGQAPEIGILWTSVAESGFLGKMSKYEITNDQFVRFLNQAIASGDITVSGNYVNGANGENTGADFAGQAYYRLDGPGYTYNTAVNGGASRINWTGTSFTIDAGFEHHPVTYVSWYGATAFCNYYGWKLPTEAQWQAVADYDGTYNYGCGIVIYSSMANIAGIYLNGTTVGGQSGAYGYGMGDMAGNVWEWTSTPTGANMVVRGGSWTDPSTSCSVTSKGNPWPLAMIYNLGFRVCR